MAQPITYAPYTLLFPLHPTKGVLLGLKKRGFGAEKWNGFGGKPEPADRNLLATASRELHEESGLLANSLSAIKTRGVLFLHSGGEAVTRGLEIWVYTVDVADCTGEIIETDEMAPKWFQHEDVPYDTMWEDAGHWLPTMLSGGRQGEMMFDCVECGKGWEGGIVRRVENWVSVDENHGGREGPIGEMALRWVEGARGVVRN